MFCARCGTSIPDGGSFCPACGKPFAIPEGAAAAAPVAAVAPAPAAAPAAAAPAPAAAPSAAAPTPAAAAAPPATAPPKKRRALRVAGAILALLILCCCCGPLAMSATGQTIDLGEIQLSDSVLKAIGVDKMLEDALGSFFLFSDDDEGSGGENGSDAP